VSLVWHEVHKQTSLQIPAPQCHGLSSSRVCLKLFGSGWTIMSPMPELHCFRIPLMDSCFITSKDSWEKSFWISFIKSKVLLQKAKPALLLESAFCESNENWSLTEITTSSVVIQRMASYTSYPTMSCGIWWES
jgi:hypothetical protein